MGKKYDKLYNHFQRFLKNIARNLFLWEVPDSIDARRHEEILLFGEAFSVGFVYKEANASDPLQAPYKDKVIVAGGAIAGVDLYNHPYEYTSANPVIIPPVFRRIGVDCAVCYNTSNTEFPENLNRLIDTYASLLADLTISMATSIRNSRVTLIPTVKDDKEAIRVNELIQNIIDGDSYALKYRASDLDGQTLFPIKAKDNIVVSELADARRCIMADFFSEIGVKVLSVDKRERTNLAEMDSNSTQIKLACDIMLRPRERWAEEMNRLFNTNISVKFNEEVVRNELFEKSMEESDADNESNA